jgi:hypothetical protein
MSTIIGSDAGSNRVANPNPGAGSAKPKRRHGNSGSYKPREKPVEVETPEEEREPDTGPQEPIEEEPLPRNPPITINRGRGGRQLFGKVVSRRGPTRPPNYRLHVIAALSMTIIITFLAGGKDVVTALKGK